MSATPWKSPSTLVNDSSVGSSSWTNIANLAARDGVLARPYYYSQGKQNMTFPHMAAIRAVVGGNLSGTQKSDNVYLDGNWNNYSDDWRYINASVLDLFGISLTASQVNASNFGVAIAYGDSGDIGSYFAKLTGFGFNVPSGATITGIEMRVIGEQRQYAGPGVEGIYVDAIQVRVLYEQAIVPNQPQIATEPVAGDSFAVQGLTDFKYSNGYEFRRKITIKSAAQVAGASNLSNFTFLFNQQHDSFRSHAYGGGVYYDPLIDIRFELPDGTKLAHEINSYDPQTGKVVAWIRIPTLYKSQNTEIYIYYGKKLVVPTSDPYNWGSVGGVGIRVGYADSNITGLRNNNNNAGGFNNGELTTYSTTMKDPTTGASLSLGDSVGENSATESGTASYGYLMYHTTATASRFTISSGGKRANYVLVRYNNGQWQYDNNSTFVNFTPNSSDILVARTKWGSASGFEVFQPLRAGEENPIDLWIYTDFEAVYHLENPPDGNASYWEHKDSGWYSHTGSSFGSMNSSALIEGQIGNGVSLDGVNDYISLAHTLPTRMAGATSIHISFWVEAYHDGTTQALLAVNTAAGGNVLILYKGAASDRLSIAGMGNDVASSVPVFDGVMHRIDYIRSGSNHYMYVDGVLSAQVGGLNPVLSNTDLWSIGTEYDSGPTAGDFSNGTFDELRISKVVKSADWILTNYRNQSAFNRWDVTPTENAFWKLGAPEFKTSQFLWTHAAGQSTAIARMALPQPIASSVSGDSDASSRLETPYLGASISGDSDANTNNLYVNPYETAPISGDSDATSTIDHEIVIKSVVAGDATATTSITQYSPDIDKIYVYDVYTAEGSFITSWIDVTSPFKMPEQINTPGSVMTVQLGRNPKSFGENADVKFNNRVIIRVVDNQEPNGKNVYQGRIVDYKPDYNDKNVSVVLESFGSQLDGMVVETGESVQSQYSVITSNEVMAEIWRFTAPNTPIEMSALEFRLRASSNASIGKTAELVVRDNGDNEIARASITLRSTSMEVYKFQFAGRPTLPQSTVINVWFEGTGEYFIQSDGVEGGGDPDRELLSRYYNSNTQVWYWFSVEEDAYFKLYQSSGSTLASYNSWELSDIIRDIMDNYNERGGVIQYTADSIENTGVIASVDLNSVSILDAINEILKHAPAGFYWYIDQGENIFHFKHLVDEAQHEFMVGHHVTELEMAKSIAQIKNVVYFSGGGSPKLYKKYVRQSSIDRYGESAKPLTDGRVELEASADLVANRYLDIYSAPRIDVAFAVADNNVDPRGYDLETVIIGQLIKLGNINSNASVQYDIAQYDLASYDYALEDVTSITFQVTSMTREKGLLIFTLSNYPSDEDTNRTIEQLKNGLTGIRTEDNPAAPSV